MEKLVELSCSIDDFWKDFNKQWEQHLITKGKSSRGPKAEMSIPEMMTISILFHQSNYRNFKHFYCSYVLIYLRREFPTLISYSRFVYLLKNLFIPLFAYLLHNKGTVTGVSFIDSTKIQVCHNKRIRRNKVFAKFAKMGKTGEGWFFGVKLHLIINEVGEILAFQLTPGNASDVSVVEILSQGITGKLYGDKGYISEKLDWLPQRQIWKKLHSLICVKVQKKSQERNSCEIRYFISSLPANAERLAKEVRNHWSIENKLHWQLDVNFREDLSRVRKGNGAENLSIVRRATLNLLQKDKTSKVSLRKRRFIASCRKDYLLDLVGAKEILHA